MKKILATLGAAVFALLPLTACGGDSDGTVTLKVNEVTHSVFYAPMYLADSLGYFEEEGLKIDLSVGQGADKSMTALISGSADIALLGTEAGIYVYNQGAEDYALAFAQLN